MEKRVFKSLSHAGVATILYESRLGCLENSVPQPAVDYTEALGLMFSMFKTSMYAGAIPRWLRPFIPKPWREFCRSWDGLFKFSKRRIEGHLLSPQLTPLPGSWCIWHSGHRGWRCGGWPDAVASCYSDQLFGSASRMTRSMWVASISNTTDFPF